jgi:hypothetical protein
MVLVAVFVTLVFVFGALLFDLNPLLGCIYVIGLVFIVLTSHTSEDDLKKNLEYRAILERLTPCLNNSDQVKCTDAEIGLIKTEAEAMSLVMLFHELNLHLNSKQLQAIRSQIIQYRPKTGAGHLTGEVINAGTRQTSALDAQKP